MVKKKIDKLWMSSFQDKVWARLHRSHTSKNIANAYIFSGPTGSGKESLAIEFSKILNCQNPNKFGCDNCASCLRILQLQHENLKLIFPLPAPTNNSNTSGNLIDSKNIDLVTRLIAEKSKDHFFKIKVPGSNRILINSIRDLRKSIYLKSDNRGRRTILIFDAHLLSMGQGEAANALLKLLEEPPQKTSFILVTDQINLVLSTIISRCQNINFPRLDDKFISDWLSPNILNVNELNFFVGLSAGNIHMAKKLILFQKQELLDLINGLIKVLLSKNSSLWRKFVQTYTKLSKDDFNMFIFHLTLLKIWFQSSNRLRMNIAHSLHKTQLKSGMMRFIDSYKNTDYLGIVSEIEKLKEAVTQNLFMPLALTTFLLKIQRKVNLK